MSSYGLNARVPKTVVRRIVEHEAINCGDERISAVLNDIIAAPVSPESPPPEFDGQGAQGAEYLTVPYELTDFFLYYFCMFSFSPSKILRIAAAAFEGAYEEKEIRKWLAVFIGRFFASQFKRSCSPDAAGAGVLSLSPRTGLKMPSDAHVKLWIEDLN
jgi:NAD+ synthase (glutamine-hydrolysing)